MYVSRAEEVILLAAKAVNHVSAHFVDLRYILRAYPGNIARLKQAIIAAIAIKPRSHNFQLNGQPLILRHMNHTGG